MYPMSESQISWNSTDKQFSVVIVRKSNAKCSSCGSSPNLTDIEDEPESEAHHSLRSTEANSSQNALYVHGASSTMASESRGISSSSEALRTQSQQMEDSTQLSASRMSDTHDSRALTHQWILNGDLDHNFPESNETNAPSRMTTAPVSPTMHSTAKEHIGSPSASDDQAIRWAKVKQATSRLPTNAVVNESQTFLRDPSGKLILQRDTQKNREIVIKRPQSKASTVISSGDFSDQGSPEMAQTNYFNDDNTQVQGGQQSEVDMLSYTPKVPQQPTTVPAQLSPMAAMSIERDLLTQQLLTLQALKAVSLQSHTATLNGIMKEVTNLRIKTPSVAASEDLEVFGKSPLLNEPTQINEFSDPVNGMNQGKMAASRIWFPTVDKPDKGHADGEVTLTPGERFFSRFGKNKNRPNLLKTVADVVMVSQSTPKSTVEPAHPNSVPTDSRFENLTPATDDSQPIQNDKEKSQKDSNSSKFPVTSQDGDQLIQNPPNSSFNATTDSPPLKSPLALHASIETDEKVFRNKAIDPSAAGIVVPAFKDSEPSYNFSPLSPSPTNQNIPQDIAEQPFHTEHGIPSSYHVTMDKELLQSDLDKSLNQSRTSPGYAEETPSFSESLSSAFKSPLFQGKKSHSNLSTTSSMTDKISGKNMEHSTRSYLSSPFSDASYATLRYSSTIKEPFSLDNTFSMESGAREKKGVSYVVTDKHQLPAHRGFTRYHSVEDVLQRFAISSPVKSTSQDIQKMMRLPISENHHSWHSNHAQEPVVKKLRDENHSLREQQRNDHLAIMELKDKVETLSQMLQASRIKRVSHKEPLVADHSVAAEPSEGGHGCQYCARNCPYMKRKNAECGKDFGLTTFLPNGQEYSSNIRSRSGDRATSELPRSRSQYSSPARSEKLLSVKSLYNSREGSCYDPVCPICSYRVTGYGTSHRPKMTSSVNPHSKDLASQSAKMSCSICCPNEFGSSNRSSSLHLQQTSICNDAVGYCTICATQVCHYGSRDGINSIPLPADRRGRVDYLVNKYVCSLPSRPTSTYLRK